MVQGIDKWCDFIRSEFKKIQERLNRENKMADISVVGIGNIIMQDEGFGVRCAEYLQKITNYPDLYKFSMAVL